MSRRRRDPMPAPARPERILARALVAGREVIVLGFRSEDGGQMILCRFEGGGGGGWFPARAVTQLQEIERSITEVLDGTPYEGLEFRFIPRGEDERQ